MNDNTTEAMHPTYREIILASPGVRHVRDWTAWLPDVGVRGFVALLVMGLLVFGWGYYKGWSGRGQAFDARAKALAEKVIAQERAKLARHAAELDALRRRLAAEQVRLDAADAAASEAVKSFGTDLCFTPEDLRKIRGDS